MPKQATLRLVTLVGSLRVGSYHAMIARTLSELAASGVRVEGLGSIGDLPHYHADTQADGFPAAATAMAAAIAAADGVVVVTPEYNYSAPGALKDALDWLSRLSSQPFAGKPVAIQTASPGQIGGARCQYLLRQVLVYLDAYVLNNAEVMNPAIAGKVDGAGTLVDAGTRAFLA